MNSRLVIGFSQRVKLDWMEEIAHLVSLGKSDKEIVDALESLLKHQMSIGNNPERGNRDKAITILLKCWSRVPEDRRPFRDHGLKLLSSQGKRTQVAIHWANAIAAYPFFGVVAETTGRLLRLQENVSASQVQRRLKERFGERETVARAARRILRTFIDWGVLLDTEKKGVYRQAGVISVDNSNLSTWMAEAIVRASEKKLVSVEELRHSLQLFPFDLTGLTAIALEANKRIEVSRQSLGENYVAIFTALPS
jgi:hypothetical protein